MTPMPACPTCRAHFDAPVRFCPTDGAALVGAQVDALVGQLVLGTYQVTGVAGQGATGVVYAARDERLGRPVAVKVLHRMFADSADMRRRFLREARAVARITHPNIVRILDMGDVHGQPAIVMDYVAGRSLADVLAAGGRMSPGRAACLARQVASALAETHARGVVHRDLKPANLMIRSTECGGESATVLDFGVAKLVDGAMLEPDQSQLTRAGEIFGTPTYIAPEQAHGDGVDARADIYSLGVVLYELLTGQVPFRGAAVTVLLGHLNRPPMPPRSIDPSIPPGLEAIVMRCLRKKPGDRYASAAALVEALDSWLARDVRDRADTGDLDRWVVADDPPDAAAFTRRRRWSLRRVAAMVLLVGLGVAGDRVSHRLVSHGGAAATSGAVGAVSQPAGAWAPVPERAVSSGRDSAATPSPPVGRAVVVAQAGYSVRVLLPERVVTGVDYEIVLDAWDPAGAALEAPEMIVTVERPDGSSRGVAARPTATAGRYRFRRSFAEPGMYHLRVFPAAGDATIRLFFEVSGAPGA